MIHAMGVFGHALLPRPEAAHDRHARRGRLRRAAPSGPGFFRQTNPRAAWRERDLSMAEASDRDNCARYIGKPELRYEQFPYEQVQQALEQVGMSPKKSYAVYIEDVQGYQRRSPRCAVSAQLRGRTAHRLRLKNLSKMFLRLHIAGRLSPLSRNSTWTYSRVTGNLKSTWTVTALIGYDAKFWSCRQSGIFRFQTPWKTSPMKSLGLLKPPPHFASVAAVGFAATISSRLLPCFLRVATFSRVSTRRSR